MKNAYETVTLISEGGEPMHIQVPARLSPREKKIVVRTFNNFVDTVVELNAKEVLSLPAPL
jgi:hypothetical protein